MFCDSCGATFYVHVRDRRPAPENPVIKHCPLCGSESLKKGGADRTPEQEKEEIDEATRRGSVGTRGPE